MQLLFLFICCMFTYLSQSNRRLALGGLETLDLVLLVICHLADEAVRREFIGVKEELQAERNSNPLMICQDRREAWGYYPFLYAYGYV